MVGRPKSPDARRATLTLRLTDELRDQLELSAVQNGRTLSKEAESRLAASFRYGSKHQRNTEAFIGLIRASIEDIEARTESSWLADINTWALVRDALGRELRGRAPPDHLEISIASALENLLLELQTATELFELCQATAVTPPNNGLRPPDIEQSVAAAERLRLQLERVRHARTPLDRVLAQFNSAVGGSSNAGPVEEEVGSGS